MRRVLFSAGAVVLAAVSIAAAQARNTASLRLVHTQPIVVAGAGFHARERVRVTLVAQGSHAQVVTATRSGSFTVSFSGVPVDRCTGFQVFAVGQRGSRAEVKRPPLPACLPA